MVEQDLSMYVTYNPSCVTPDTPLDEMVRMIDELGFQQWPVVDEERRLVGLIEDTAIVAARTLAPNHGNRRTHPAAGAVATAYRVAEIMQPEPFSVTVQNLPKTVLKLVLENDVHSLPVVEDRRLLGLITSTDFLREFSYGELPACRESLEEYVETCVDSVEIGTNLSEVADWFESHERDLLPVVQGACPLGVVSRRDLRKATCRFAARDWLERRHSVSEHVVLEIATSCPSLRPSQKLGDAARLMIERSVEALPVVNQARRLLGVVTEERILREMYHAM